jgi:hypothetical protein
LEYAGNRLTAHASSSASASSSGDKEYTSTKDDRSSTGMAGGTGAVYKAVAIACLGAVLFGYHLGIVNGPLQEISGALLFPDDVAKQGLVRK